MPAGTSTGPNDALTAARFSLSVDGLALAQFSDLIEIASGVDPSELELGPNQRRKALKQTLPTITMSRGQNNDLSLATWHRDALADVAARRDAELIMYSTSGQAVAKYNLVSAWPARLEVTGVKAGATDVLFETVTFACEDIQRVAP